MGLYIGNNKYKVMIGNQRGSFVTKDSLLPAGYVQLEYIESSGTQYIDTRVVDLIGNVYELSVLPISTTEPKRFSILGANMGININIVNLKWQIATFETTASVDFNNFQKLVAERTPRERKLTINEKIFTTSVGNNTTLTFFIARGNGMDGGILPAKFSNCKIWRNDILVRNLIPARRNSDNVVGMYDLVNNTFYTNEGTGNFIAGPVVNN